MLNSSFVTPTRHLLERNLASDVFCVKTRAIVLAVGDIDNRKKQNTKKNAK